MKIIKKILPLVTSFVLCFSSILPVYADIDDGNNIQPLLGRFPLGINSTPYIDRNTNNNYRYKRLKIVTLVTGSSISQNQSTGSYLNLLNIQVYCFLFRNYNSTSAWNTAVYFCDKSLLTSGYDVYVLEEYSADSINWKSGASLKLSTTYQYNDGGTVGTEILYVTQGINDGDKYVSGFFHPNYGIGKLQNDVDVPIIKATSSQQTVNTVLGVISGNIAKPWPWDGSNSSGGRYWSDGIELTPENTSKYSQIFIVMDENHDNNVTESEVYYYNSTYNTNYDYSEINNGNSFNEDQFLYAIALLINGGNENPGGGTGSGGGSSSIGGGITVTDSFTQSQYQTIEENAVNVTVNNNNELSQENMQSINQIINQSVETGENNPFEQSIGNMNQFLGVARAFSALAGSVLSFLPWWVTALLTLMFTILFVMVIFRLIHLFV